MKIAKDNYIAGSVFQYVGGLFIGYPIGISLGGGKPNWALTGIGAGLAVISIPFTVAYIKHAKNAVMIYNKGLKYSSMIKIDLRMTMTNNGVGLKITF